MDLAGVASGASGVEVERDGNADAADDEIAATWSGPGSPQLEHRIALRVQVGTENNWEWVVFTPTGGTATAPAQPGITRGTDPNTDSGADWGKWTMADFDLVIAAATWTDDDNGDLYSVTAAALRGASHLRVDTRVDDGGRWSKGTPAAIPPSG